MVPRNIKINNTYLILLNTKYENELTDVRHFFDLIIKTCLTISESTTNNCRFYDLCFLCVLWFLCVL